MSWPGYYCKQYGELHADRGGKQDMTTFSNVLFISVLWTCMHHGKYVEYSAVRSVIFRYYR